ncbi:hypothetical protein [Paenibacillus senegalensis]|uniref:hypothetical protein n=1 Tax=Paenibacillus senegalensis TaxID=1465766 RepID=UPI0002893760|nr:hypothetical protein [Paenibacillus senegalensis]
MNLADMLSYSDIADLSKIAQTYACECNTHSKNELIQSILSNATRKDVLEKQIGDMSLEEIRFVNTLLFDQRESFSLEDLLARANQTRFSDGSSRNGALDQNLGQGQEQEQEQGEISAWNPRELILKNKHRGWLFNGHSQNTRYLFHVPRDIKKRIKAILAGRFSSQLEVIGEEPEVYREEQGLLSNDLLFFLHYVHQNGPQLSAEGFIYKRPLQHLLEGMAVQEELPGRAAWRFGYGRRFREYPTRFSFLYDYAYYQHLIEETGEQLLVSSAGLERLAARKEESIKALYQFWLKLYKGAVPNLQAIVQWIETLAAEWTTVRSLEQVLLPLIKPFYYDQPEAILQEKILKMLLHLGMLKMGEHSVHGQVVQINKLGSSVIQGSYVPEDEKIQLDDSHSP